VDIFPLRPWPCALARTPAQLVQYLAGALDIGLVGDLDVAGIDHAHARLVVAAERVARLAVAVAPVGRHLVAAAGLHHLLKHGAGALLRLVVGARLGIDRTPRVAPAQRLGGIAHRPLGAPQRAGDVTGHLAEATHDVAEPAAQALLLLGVAAG